MLLTQKSEYYIELDKIAEKIASNFIERSPVTNDILRVVQDLYRAAKVEHNYETRSFSSAYHPSITSEFEFFIARFFYHINLFLGLGWTIFLRRQKNKCSPDIRIELNSKTIAVIELKAKVGWIQSFISPNFSKIHAQRFSLDATAFNPDAFNDKLKNNLLKYAKAFTINHDQIYFVVPSLKEAHRKKNSTSIAEYCTYFSSVSELPQDNFILMSNNLSLDLSDAKASLNKFEPSSRFEQMIDNILAVSNTCRGDEEMTPMSQGTVL